MGRPESHLAAIGTQDNAVKITFGHDLMMRPAHRHRIIVPVKPHQQLGLYSIQPPQPI
jgi:hypothetical protein